MLGFAVVFLGLVFVTIFFQVLSTMKIIGGNELGIMAGENAEKGFKTYSGARVFQLPFLNKFAKMDLTPRTIEVKVESAIAAGIVPLNVKATVSFAIASNQSGRIRAATRILHFTKNWPALQQVASDIIEGHLRDSIASITPEQVMKDKDTLVAKMINACKMDLENIGLEITTMNIADVEDHRLDEVTEPDLYIALLKRIQTTNAEVQARVAQAESRARSAEQEHAQRAEVEVRKLENELENLKAQMSVQIKQEIQRKNLGIQQVNRDAEAHIAGIKRKVAAEKENIEMLKEKYEAEIIVPMAAKARKVIIDAEVEGKQLTEKSEGEISQLQETLQIIASLGQYGKEAFLIENFNKIIKPFGETMQLFPVHKLSVIAGRQENQAPISAIHPHAVAAGKNQYVAHFLGEALPESQTKNEMKT